MGQATQPTKFRIIHIGSRLLTWAGELIFLLGGKLLHEIEHQSFFASEIVCTFIGIVLILVGGAIAVRIKELQE